MTGAVNRGDDSNEGFQRICDASEVAASAVKACAGAGCTTFESFLKDDGIPLDPLIKALDSNNDGRVTSADRACRVTFLGFSWGGVGVANLARKFVDSNKIDASRKQIDLLIAMDPYRPQGSVNIPKEVKQAYVFRRSIVPSGDCSKGAPLGPYVGIKPTCEAPAQCTDLDFSLAPNQLFPRLDGSQTKGADVGHCTVPWVSGPSVLDLVQGKSPSNLPPKAR
jgi:hypothetical protein